MNGFGLHSLALVIWLTVMAALALLYMTVPPSPDQSQFDWMAFIATQGQPFYKGSFDMNWPGAMWLHEAGIRLFGVHAWTWRLTDFLLMAGFTVAGALFLSRAGWQVAPLIFLFLYPPLYITAGGWMAGQRDIIATGFLLGACALAIPGRRREGIAVVTAGLFVAAAVLIRPTFLSFIVGLILLEALPLKLHYSHTQRLGHTRRAIGFAAGLTTGVGAAVAAGFVLGNLDDWYQQSIKFSLSVYAGDPPQDWRITLNTLFVSSWHWITILALVGFGLWARRDKFGYALILAIGVAVTSAVSFAVQNKGFGYHLGGVLPVLVLFASVALDGLEQLRRTTVSYIGSMVVFLALSLAGLLALTGTAAKLMNLKDGAQLLVSGKLGPTEGYGLTEKERREIIAMIKEGSTATDTVAIYGTNYELAYRAKRLPTYRFFTPAADQITSRFRYHEDWLSEIESALETRAPAFVIIRRSAIKESAVNPVPAFPNRPILGRLVMHLYEGYEIAFKNAHVIVYRKAP